MEAFGIWRDLYLPSRARWSETHLLFLCVSKKEKKKETAEIHLNEIHSQHLLHVVLLCVEMTIITTSAPASGSAGLVGRSAGGGDTRTHVHTC